MKILITGFESIGNDEFSPSVDLIKTLPIVVEDSFIVKLEVPALFTKSIEVVTAAIDEHDPDAVICVGQAGGRFGLTPEFVAINYVNSNTPDNAGICPINNVVSLDGPAAYFTDLPIDIMVDAINVAGVPSEISYSAGTSLNNSLMYGVARHIDQTHSQTIFGFLHIPYATFQTVGLAAPCPSLSVSDMRTGIEAAVRAVALYLKERNKQPVYNDMSTLSSAYTNIDNLYFMDKH